MQEKSFIQATSGVYSAILSVKTLKMGINLYMI